MRGPPSAVSRGTPRGGSRGHRGPGGHAGFRLCMTDVFKSFSKCERLAERPPRGRPGPASSLPPRAKSGSLRGDITCCGHYSEFSLQCMGSHETNSNNQDETNEDKRTAPAAHYPLTAHLRSNEHHVRRPQRTLSPTPLSPHVNLMDDMHRACARPPRQNRT